MSTTEVAEVTATKPGRDARGFFAKGNRLQPSSIERSPSLVSILKRQLRENPEDAEAIVKQLIRLGKKGGLSQLNAIKEIFDRLDGKAVETHKVDVDNSVTLLFVPANKVLPPGEFKELPPVETLELPAPEPVGNSQ